MKKSHIGALVLATSIVLSTTYVLVKNSKNNFMPMKAVEITKSNNKTKVTLENEEMCKTIILNENDKYYEDLPNMFYLTKDGINISLCEKTYASKYDLETETTVKNSKEVYCKVATGELIINPDEYTIMTVDKFHQMYQGLENQKNFKLTILN
ncbi:MAG: hypothetical protein RR325_03190 [Bacilli bacterium]